MSEREQFIRELNSGQYSLAELAERYGISRKTAYKWKERHHVEGLVGLVDRSRAPKTCPHQTPLHIRELILAEKKRYSRWGAPKLLDRLRKRHPDLELPAASTAGALLKKHGLTKPGRRRRRWEHPGAPVRRPTAPNMLWTVDFKGQFRLLNGAYCYPLTVADLATRYLLGCTGLTSTKTVGAMPVFTRLFREFGLPDAIRSDNGAPFCSANAIHGLCELNVWWMRLGIHHERTEPSSPQQNGAHERMHRTLKRDTTRPPAKDLQAQQRVFDRFRVEYNDERPHDALDGDMPAEHYTPSTRPFPKRLGQPEYPDEMMVRRVSTAGTFRLNRAQPFLASSLAGLDIGIEEVDDGLWAIVFANVLLGHYNQRTKSYVE